MRMVWVPVLLVALAVPLAAHAQSGASILGGQTTAVELTRAQALRDIERSGYGSVTKLTLGPAGTWTAMTSRGAVKVNPAGQVTHMP
jgi:predicted porin